MYNMLCFLAQVLLFLATPVSLLLASTVVITGPCSFSRPNIEELPGPPCSQITTGAVSGDSSAGKNQKKMLPLLTLSAVMNPD